METFGQPSAVPARRRKSAISPVLTSAAAHLVVLGVLIYHGRHWIAPVLYPGTEHGHNIVLTYLPGRAPAQSLAPAPKPPTNVAKAEVNLPKPEKIEPKPETTSPNANSISSNNPDSASGADALGSGDINIALVKYFPRPKPDLSTMAEGTKGDVILDVTIDESGKVSDLKLVKGIEHSIDETVIATIRQWTFNPANRDGHPIASEQELHFHYEKG
jgi:protein TonB